MEIPTKKKATSGKKAAFIPAINPNSTNDSQKKKPEISPKNSNSKKNKSQKKSAEELVLVKDTVTNLTTQVINIAEFLFLWFICWPLLLFSSVILVHRYVFHFPDHSDFLQYIKSICAGAGIFYGTHRIMLPLLAMEKDFIFLEDMKETIKFQIILYFFVILGIFYKLKILEYPAMFFTPEFFKRFCYFWILYTFIIVWMKVYYAVFMPAKVYR